ncbi:hypothetical protein [Vibrio lentus]|nr:hypothetical protein [Vibrio lentus]
MFLSEAKKKENKDIRLLLDSNRWKEMTDDELREARIKLNTYVGLAVENSRKYIEAYRVLTFVVRKMFHSAKGVEER